MRMLLLMLALGTAIHGASLIVESTHTTNCVYLTEANSTPVTISTSGSNGSSTCAATAQVDGGATGVLLGPASSISEARGYYGSIDARAVGKGSGPEGSGGGTGHASVSFTDAMAFYGVPEGIVGFELVTSLSATRDKPAAIVRPAVTFLLNLAAQASPVLGYPGAPDSPLAGTVTNVSATSAYYVRFVSGVKIPFFVGATVDAAGSGAIADLSLSISMLVKVYNTDGTLMASCTYTTDSNAPYNVACATNVTMSPEPSSALLCGAGCVLVYLRRSRLMRLLR